MSKKEQQYSAIMADLYQGTLDDATWDRALIGLARLVGGEGPLLMSCRHGQQAMMRYNLYSYDSEMFCEYTSHWLTCDPRVPRAAGVTELGMFTEVTLLQRGQWERTAIFNEYLKPNDAAWVLGSTLHNNPEKFTLLCIQATSERGPFSADEAETIRPLMPHLRRALEIKDRIEYQGIRADALGQSVDGLSFGLLVLDEQGRVLEATAAASAVLNDVCLTPLRSGEHVHLPDPVQRELSTLLSSSLKQGRLSDGLLHVQRAPDRMPLSILVIPAPVVLQSWILNTPRWLLFVFDPEQGLNASASLLEKELHLSPREAQIASMLAARMTLAQIAARVRISANTLRTHLKACFNKTGCHAQGELIARIANSVSSRIHKQQH